MLSNRKWDKASPANETAIDMLKTISPNQLPSSYIKLLSYSNGGEGPLPVDPLYFILDSAENCIRIYKDKTFEEYFEGLFVIGGNGGGDAIAIDMRKPAPFPVVSFDMTNIDLDESVWLVANSFSEFFDYIGIE